MPVPEEGQLFAQGIGAVEHSVQPPGLEPVEVLAHDGPLGQGFGHRLFRGGPLRRIQQPVHSRLRPGVQIALELSPSSREPRTAVQMSYFPQVPRVAGLRSIRRPRLCT